MTLLLLVEMPRWSVFDSCVRSPAVFIDSMGGGACKDATKQVAPGVIA